MYLFLYCLKDNTEHLDKKEKQKIRKKMGRQVKNIPCEFFSMNLP